MTGYFLASRRLVFRSLLRPGLRECAVFAILIFVFAIAANAQDFSAYQKKEFSGMPYRILFPRNYANGKKYPLILFLHGAGERGTDNAKQLVHGGSLFINDRNSKKFPAIVLFPQCPENEYWTHIDLNGDQHPRMFDFDYSQPPTDSLKKAIELTQSIIRKERVDPKRVYVLGLSMGGMGTFEAVYRYPELFAAAIPICGGGDVHSYDQRVKGFPFWVFHGAEDDLVDVANSRAMVQRLKELKAKVKYTEYPHVKHESWDLAFAEPKFLHWLFSNRKN